MVRGHRVSGRMMGGFRRVIGLIAVPLLVDASHLLSSSLIFSPSLLDSALFLKSMTLGRAAIRVSWWSRWASVSHIMHAGPIFLTGRLLHGRLVFPLPHPLGGYGRRPFITMQFGSHRAFWWHGATALHAWFLMVRVGRLVLRIS